MRIATSTIHARSVREMQTQQSQLSKTQNEVASGKRVQSPADDPIATTRILSLQQTQTALVQYDANSNSAKTRLSLEEQALSDMQDVLSRVSELSVEANSSTLSQSDRESITTELEALNDELLSIANRKDTNGEYLFSGMKTQTEPFALNSSGSIAYYGDQSARSLQIGSNQYVQDGHSGYEVLMDIPSGNGTFAMAANGANTGTGVISNGSVTDMNAWVSDTYDITFTTATAWEVTDSAGNVVTSGTYESGSVIEFNGIQLSIGGTPAAGDSFTVSPSASQDVFTTLGNLITAIDQPQDTELAQANFQNSLIALQTQLQQTEDHVLSVRTEIGARLNTIDNADGARQTYSDLLTNTISDLRDSDYAESISRMSQQEVSLQAAQQSYTTIAKLSLFNYL